MNLDTAIRLTAQVQGANNIRGLAQQFQGLTATSQVSGRQLDKLYTETRKLAAAAGGSINALRQQRTALATLRDAVEPTSRRFQLLTRDVEALDRRLKALNGTQQQVANSQRGMARQAAGSALGTLATGGGVQGAVGALAGGLAFSGSAAGLAAGAAVTGLAVGGAAASSSAVAAAEISKLQIALKGVTPSIAQYETAVKAASAVSRAFNIPIADATRAMTQLSAAVIGAGGTAKDAEVVFRNVAGAVKATGGSAEDVDGALRAVIQTFSKGKVSAEELRGQLGERLPGAITRFAEATGRTLPQLDKDLEQGKVGLADFMKFITSEQGLGGFPKIAQTVASSNAEAGARLATAWQRTQVEIGNAVLPIGAQIQNSLGKLLTELTPSLVSVAKALAGSIKLLVDNAGAIGNLARFAAILAAVNATFKLMPGLVGSARVSLALLATQFGKTSAQAVVAQASLTKVKASLLSLGKIGLITVGVDVVINGASKLADIKTRLDKIRNSGTRQFTADIGGSALSREEIEKQITDNRAEFERRKQELASVRFPLLTGQDEVAKAAILQLDTRLAALRTLLDRAQYETAAQRNAAGLTKFENTSGEDAARKEREKAEKEAQKAAQQALERQIALQERLSDLRLRTEERVADLMEATNERALQMVQQINDEKLQGERRIKALQAETAGNYADIQLNLEILRQRASGMPTAGLETRLRLDQSRRQYDAETISIVNEAKDRDQELTRRLSDFSKGFTDSLQGIFTQGAEQYRDAMQDAARDEEKAMRRLQSTGSRSAVTPRAAALLDTIAFAEGTWDSRAQSPRYNVGFGYNTFDNARPHPGRVWRSGGYASAASGAFQFMPDTWRMINGGQNLPMNAANQDRAALGLISRRGVDPNAEFSRALAARLAPEWASFPTMAGASYYGQPVKKFEDLQRFYQQRLGAYSATAAPIAQPLPAARPASSYEVPGAAGITTAAGGLSDAIVGEANARSGNSLSELLKQRLSELSDATSEIDSQTQSTTQQLENYQRQLVLVRGGLSPEIAQMRVEAERSLDIERQSLQVLEQRLVLDLQDKTISADTRSVMSEILKSVQGRLAAQPGIVEGLVAERVQLDELTRAYEDQKALVEGISGSIGNGLSASLDLLISGTEDWGNSLREIASGVLQDIARQLAQSLVVKPVVNAISGAFGFANGGIMTSAGPLPLRAYANGGIASSPQLALFGEGRMPEAYVPLPDGRRIPVAMQGGGGSNVVNVTVNAEGSQVQGDSGQSEQLGRVVAKAIQEEMIRQRRPGGLLASA